MEKYNEKYRVHHETWCNGPTPNLRIVDPAATIVCDHIVQLEEYQRLCGLYPEIVDEMEGLPVESKLAILEAHDELMREQEITYQQELHEQDESDTGEEEPAPESEDDEDWTNIPMPFEVGYDAFVDDLVVAADGFAADLWAAYMGIPANPPFLENDGDTPDPEEEWEIEELLQQLVQVLTMNPIDLEEWVEQEMPREPRLSRPQGRGGITRGGGCRRGN